MKIEKQIVELVNQYKDNLRTATLGALAQMNLFGVSEEDAIKLIFFAIGKHVEYLEGAVKESQKQSKDEIE